jgi:NADH-quinone oxidoreductase subunit E
MSSTERERKPPRLGGGRRAARKAAKAGAPASAPPANGHDDVIGVESTERRRLAHRAVPRYAHGSRVPGWDDAVDLSKPPAEVPDAAVVDVPRELRSEIEAIMALYPDSRSAALPALAAAQRHHGWCSPAAITDAACVMRLTPGYLVAIATFYDMFETTKPGRHSIYVCTNISCSLRGADELHAALRLAAGEDPELNVRGFECLGACDIAPMASVDNVYVGPLTLDDVEPLLADIRAGRPPLPAKQLLGRRSADAAADDYPRDQEA